MIGCCTPYQICSEWHIKQCTATRNKKPISFYLASHVPFIIYRNNVRTIIIKLKSVCNYYQRTEKKL